MGAEVICTPPACIFPSGFSIEKEQLARVKMTSPAGGGCGDLERAVTGEATWPGLAMGGKVIFMPPGLFCMDRITNATYRGVWQGVHENGFTAHG